LDFSKLIFLSQYSFPWVIFFCTQIKIIIWKATDANKNLKIDTSFEYAYRILRVLCRSLGSRRVT
jgi:hypothetical protein